MTILGMLVRNGQFWPLNWSKNSPRATTPFPTSKSAVCEVSVEDPCAKMEIKSESPLKSCFMFAVESSTILKRD